MSGEDSEGERSDGERDEDGDGEMDEDDIGHQSEDEGEGMTGMRMSDDYGESENESEDRDVLGVIGREKRNTMGSESDNGSQISDESHGSG